MNSRIRKITNRFCSQPKSKIHKFGFTLIELLVVIAIIGLLASIILIALNGARVQARMSQRVGNLKETQSALELYYNDNGSYPVSANSGTWDSICSGWGMVLTTDQTIPALTPGYMIHEPTDPLVNTSLNTSCYLYRSDGRDYKYIDYNLTDATALQINSNYATFADPARNIPASQCSVPGTFSSGAPTLAIWTTGAICW